MIQKRVGHLNQTPTTTYSYATFKTAIWWFCLMFRHATFTTAIWWFCLMRRRLERRRTLYKWLGVSMTATFPHPFHCFLPWFQANKNLRLKYIFWDFLKYFEIFWDFLRFFEIFWGPVPIHIYEGRDILRYFEKFWDIFRFFEKFWEILRNFEKFWENLRNFEKFWEILRNFGPLPNLIFSIVQLHFFNCPIKFWLLLIKPCFLRQLQSIFFMAVASTELPRWGFWANTRRPTNLELCYTLSSNLQDTWVKTIPNVHISCQRCFYFLVELLDRGSKTGWPLMKSNQISSKRLFFLMEGLFKVEVCSCLKLPLQVSPPFC